MLPGSILMLTDISPDFRVTYCVYSRDIFAEASSAWSRPSSGF